MTSKRHNLKLSRGIYKRFFHPGRYVAGFYLLQINKAKTIPVLTRNSCQIPWLKSSKENMKNTELSKESIHQYQAIKDYRSISDEKNAM
jgi:hypothetical protein